MLKYGKFTVRELRPIRDAMTVSRSAEMGERTKVTFFSLGKDTSISQESYDDAVLYVGAAGSGYAVCGEEKKKEKIEPGNAVYVPNGKLCGFDGGEGVIYTEIILKGNHEMNEKIKAGEAFKLKDLISYEEGSIANLDVVKGNGMKYVLMAFDEGTGLTPHRAPGNAIVFALEGKATIGYEGKDYELSEGECFRFEKNGLHSVTANGRFKMALLLVIE